MGTPDLFAPPAAAERKEPRLAPARRPPVDAARLMRGMARLPRPAPARDVAGQDLCLHCGEALDFALPFVAVGGYEEREAADGRRLRRPAGVFLHAPCHAAWWGERVAAALKAAAEAGPS